MRVLIDYRSALRGRSGVGEYAYQLVHALLSESSAGRSNAAVELALFSSSWKDRLVLPTELQGATAIDRRLPVSLLNFAWHRLGWPPVEWLAGLRCDVTHSLHPLLMPARDAAQVITIHDLNFLAHPERTRAEIRRDYPSLTRDHAHRADRIVVPSRFTASEVQRLLAVPAAKISVCSPGAPDWTARPPALTTADGYILFLGTLEPRKNVGTLLDAYAQLLESPAAAKLPSLVLAGMATAESQPWIDRIARPPLAGVVRHIGYVNPDDRVRVYDGARMLVQPSFEEGFGIPVLEAMTRGIPVIAANRGALPEVLGDAGLLIDPQSASEMAGAIQRLLEDEALAQRCVADGIARARLFSWPATAGQMFDVYRQAIASRAERRH